MSQEIMDNVRQLKNPVLIAAWPGMGHVAVTACYYLIAKLKMETYLSNALEQVKGLMQENGEPENADNDEAYIPDPMENGRLSQEEKDLIESLFEIARADRSRAFELKRELDRLDVFSEYEDRFLDLFKQDSD